MSLIFILLGIVFVFLLIGVIVVLAVSNKNKETNSYYDNYSDSVLSSKELMKAPKAVQKLGYREIVQNPPTSTFQPILPKQYANPYVATPLPPEPINIAPVNNMTEVPIYRYRRRESLLSSTEKEFFYALEKAFGFYYKIFSKVRLADIIEPDGYMGNNKEGVWQITSKHVDFVVCDKKTMQFVCAIELDDSSHKHVERANSDKIKEEGLFSANVPLLRFPARQAYSITEVGTQINQKMGLLLEDLLNKNIFCPKCNSDLMVRVSSQNKNNIFSGCKNYPACKYVDFTNKLTDQ